METAFVILLALPALGEDLAQREVEHQCEVWAAQMIEAGVMEEDERSLFFVHRAYQNSDSNRWAFEYDRDLMINRQRRMDPDCPTVEVVPLLPPYAVVWGNRDQATQFLNYLNHCLRWESPAHEEVYRQLIAETEWRLEVWKQVTAARGWGYGDGRRLALQKLRATLGRERFERLEFPDPLPDCAYTQPWPRRSSYP